MGQLGLEYEKGLYLGIDFGTTNTVVSVYDYDQGEVYTLPIDGQAILPTVIQFEEDLEVAGKLDAIIGIEAKEAAIIYPESTILSVKRLVGKDQPIEVVVGGVTYDFKPEDIVAQILSYIKRQAGDYLHNEKFISGEFSGCVITVPANSTDKQKFRMREAAISAGFLEDDVHLRLEPAAAAITYAKSATKDSKVLVYDFGGGTFDACLLSLASMSEDEPVISILSAYGDNHLGGNDLDQIMIDMIYQNFLEETNHKIDLFDLNADDGVSKKQKKMAILRLHQAANQAKERLSTTGSTRVVLAPFLQEPQIVNLNLEVTRETYYNHKRQHALDDPEEIYELMKDKSVVDLVAKTMSCVHKCISAADMTVDEVDEIFLVGGSSALPEVVNQIESIFNKSPYKSIVSPALSISIGAAYYCHMIMLPSSSGPKILEHTLHPIGLEIAGRRFLEIVEEGLPIPEEGLTVTAEEPLYTNYDDIDNIAIVIYEDTSPEVGPKRLKFVHEEGMKRLGGVTLKGIPEAPKGQEKVEVTFSINRDNLLTVEASSLSTEGVSTVLTVDDLY